jgi:hypothetical protein
MPDTNDMRSSLNYAFCRCICGGEPDAAAGAEQRGLPHIARKLLASKAGADALRQPYRGQRPHIDRGYESVQVPTFGEVCK